MMRARVCALDTRVLRVTPLFYIPIRIRELFRIRRVILLLEIRIYQKQQFHCPYLVY